ncbi:MAG: queuosine salvage family protein [Patescibacteria group bacterium]|nr:queuosine salvage family protein [Patescibacteria group bacterium]
MNRGQVERAAEVVATLPDSIKPLNFYSFDTPGGEIVAEDMYPPLDHQRAIDFFFFVMLHNYGFWHGDEKGYASPLYGTLGGKRRKGSDMLWRIVMRQLDEDPDRLRPKWLASESVSDDELTERFFSDDDGVIAFPDLDDRIRRTRAYGHWFTSGRMTTQKLVEVANAHNRTLTAFHQLMSVVAGYTADPLEKRQTLLAMALHNRPEQFLKVTDPERWYPIVDYHLMRVCLRSGMVELEPHELEANTARAWVSAETEAEIRQECDLALTGVLQKSGRSHALNDFAFWKARRSCPEMEEPNCDKCHFNGFCAKRSDLFQPVFRTTHY